jgi:uncharacterized membrane protein YfcA
MTPLLFTLIVFAASFAAGLLGSLVGVGGGIIVVPVLTLLFGVKIQYAIGASIVSVIATSSAGAASYVRERLVNLRVAMLLEVFTAAGALAGALAAPKVSARSLFLLFGALMAYTAWNMSRPARGGSGGAAHPSVPDALADRLKLHSHYIDRATGEDVHYRVGRTRIGLAVSAVAGVMSGLLGIGGGTLKVPAMNLAMGIPLKVCTATSNFMIGVTAAASAAVYFMRGEILPFVAAPVATGVLLGATAGSKLLGRTHSAVVRVLFVIVLSVTAVQMLIKGLR